MDCYKCVEVLYILFHTVSKTRWVAEPSVYVPSSWPSDGYLGCPVLACVLLAILALCMLVQV